MQAERVAIDKRNVSAFIGVPRDHADRQRESASTTSNIDKSTRLGNV